VAPRLSASYLAPGELVQRHFRHHPASLLRPFFETIGAIVAAGVLGTLTSPDRADHPIDTLLGTIAILFAARFGWRLLQWLWDRVFVTDARLFEVSGILTRKVASMPLTNLTELTYRRSLPGRVLGYGDIVIETPGQEQALRHLAYVPDPHGTYLKITSLLLSGAPRDDDTGELFR
jgi:hypothetical protein